MAVKQPPTVFLVVGTNKSATVRTVPTWFYVFNSMKSAQAFITHAKEVAPTVTWDDAVYPCEVDSISSGVEAFKQAVKESQE